MCGICNVLTHIASYKTGNDRSSWHPGTTRTKGMKPCVKTTKIWSQRHVTVEICDICGEKV